MYVGMLVGMLCVEGLLQVAQRARYQALGRSASPDSSAEISMFCLVPLGISSVFLLLLFLFFISAVFLMVLSPLGFWDAGENTFFSAVD